MTPYYVNLYDEDWDVPDPAISSFSEECAVEEFAGTVEDIGEYTSGYFEVYAVRYLCEIPREYNVLIEYDPVFTASLNTEGES